MALGFSSPYLSPSQLPHNWLHGWLGGGAGGEGGGREGQSQPQTCPQRPLPQCIAGLVRALSSSSFGLTPRPATPGSSHTELGLLTMRAGSPSSQGSRCGFQTIELTLRGPVARQTCAPSTSVGVEWEGVSLSGSFASSSAYLWGGQLPKQQPTEGLVRGLPLLRF